jgi:hypothetical protein
LVETTEEITMPAQFELVVSQRLARLRALERALHDEGPWAFRVGDVHADGTVSYYRGIPAERRVDSQNQRVVFRAELCSPLSGDVSVDLMTVRDRELVSSQRVHLPHGHSLFEWELGLEPVAA